LTRRTEIRIAYVMNTKLTLRMDQGLIRHAKAQAAQRGKSVSQMFGEFVTALGAIKPQRGLPPVTNSLVGVMRGARLSEEDYKAHLRVKYL
jgi:hypothetical protein